MMVRTASFLLLCFILGLCISTASAQTRTWGNRGTRWDDAGGWRPRGVPTSASMNRDCFHTASNFSLTRCCDYQRPQQGINKHYNHHRSSCQYSRCSECDARDRKRSFFVCAEDNHGQLFAADRSRWPFESREHVQRDEIARFLQ